MWNIPEKYNGNCMNDYYKRYQERTQTMEHFQQLKSTKPKIIHGLEILREEKIIPPTKYERFKKIMKKFYQELDSLFDNTLEKNK